MPAFVKDREQFTETLQKQIWDLVLTNPQVADMGVEFMCGKVHRGKHTPVVVVAEKDRKISRRRFSTARPTLLRGAT